MEFSTNWRTRFEQELAMAERARQQGNEAQARVCARRAAGVVIEEYFKQNAIAFRSPSAYDLLNYLAGRPETPSEVKTVAQRLVLRVNTAFTLPIQADLVADARWLAKTLLGSGD